MDVFHQASLSASLQQASHTALERETHHAHEVATLRLTITTLEHACTETDARARAQANMHASIMRERDQRDMDDEARVAAATHPLLRQVTTLQNTLASHQSSAEVCVCVYVCLCVCVCVSICMFVSF